ncbi:MAG: hypothetical protein R3C03_23805 [Pirellulaceae bacterium]
MSTTPSIRSLFVFLVASVVVASLALLLFLAGQKKERDVLVVDLQQFGEVTRSSSNVVLQIPLCHDSSGLFYCLELPTDGVDKRLSAEDLLFTLFLSKELGRKVQIIVFHDGSADDKRCAKIHCEWIAHLASGVDGVLLNNCVYYKERPEVVSVD